MSQRHTRGERPSASLHSHHSQLRLGVDEDIIVAGPDEEQVYDTGGHLFRISSTLAPVRSRLLDTPTHPRRSNKVIHRRRHTAGVDPSTK